MNKLGRLLQSFVQMSALHHRLSAYLDDHAEVDIERDIQRCKNGLERETDAEVKASLRQNLALALKRLKQHRSITSTHKVVSVKMDTLEKAFGYLRSHVVGMGRREELTEEIDGLVLGVESVEELSRETGSLFDDAPVRTESAAMARPKPRKLRS